MIEALDRFQEHSDVLGLDYEFRGDLDTGKIDAIFVHPNHMGAGVGKQILLHLEQIAIEAGLTQLKLDSTLNASSFYRAYGFEGEKVSKYKSPWGATLDCIPMAKHIRSDA